MLEKVALAVPVVKFSWSVPLIVLAVPVQFQILSVVPTARALVKVSTVLPAPISMVEATLEELRESAVSVNEPVGLERVPPAITIAELFDKTLLPPIRRVPEVMVVLPL